MLKFILIVLACVNHASSWLIIIILFYIKYKQVGSEREIKNYAELKKKLI
jgi:hypothetical protein